MRKAFILVVFTLSFGFARAQALYFPPTSGTTWDTLSPSTLGWCQPNIDALYSYLQLKGTKAFIILKDGKIVLEKYFGTFTIDSPHLWNSASKSLTATLTGIAQEKGLVNIDSPATHYLGAGWTSCTPAQEDSITLLNLLTMTSGLNPLPNGCANTDTSVACLDYLVPAGSQWSYHTGAYRKLENVLSNASSLNYNILTRNYVGTVTGMTGLWVQQEFASTARSAARFGLLTLNHDIWAGDTLLHDTAYFRAMTNTSQPYNLSYGYLWWLNGKASYMTPGPQLVAQGELIPNGQPDMLCALGKNDQKIYVIPSTNMVVVRMGNAADSTTDASSSFDNILWGKIDSLTCTPNSVVTQPETPNLNIYPNPSSGILYFQSININATAKIVVCNMLGEAVAEYSYASLIDISHLPQGVYVIRLKDGVGNISGATRIVKE